MEFGNAGYFPRFSTLNLKTVSDAGTVLYSKDIVRCLLWGYHTNRFRWLASQAKDTGSSPVIPTSAVVKFYCLHFGRFSSVIDGVDAELLQLRFTQLFFDYNLMLVRVQPALLFECFNKHPGRQ